MAKRRRQTQDEARDGDEGGVGKDVEATKDVEAAKDVETTKGTGIGTNNREDKSAAGSENGGDSDESVSPSDDDSDGGAQSGEDTKGASESASQSTENPNTETSKATENSEAAPPLPKEPAPGADDGWIAQWSDLHHEWYFHNSFTGQTQWDNPRVPKAATTEPTTAPPLPPSAPPSDGIVSGYNPAIHGDYDPNAWYAQGYDHDPDTIPSPAADDADALDDTIRVGFNRWTGQFQTDGPERHSDDSKARRQMGAFFDVDAAANSHDGRSLRAERQGKRISKAELKQFKERRKARKEEKRRAWLRD